MLKNKFSYKLLSVFFFFFPADISMKNRKEGLIDSLVCGGSTTYTADTCFWKEYCT